MSEYSDNADGMLDEALAHLHVALSQEGWMSPFRADVNQFSDEQLKAGELQAADREADRQNREALRAALASLPPKFADALRTIPAGGAR